jgi:RNA ligase
MLTYNFPRIEHIDDVKMYVEGRDGFRISEKGWYTNILYTIPSPEIFTGSGLYETSVLRECRGLVFDTETGRILARPYHKIFNIDQLPETQSGVIDLSPPHTVLEKLDGSMVFPVAFGDSGDFRLMTKSGVTETSMRAEQFVSSRPAYQRFIRMCVKGCKLTPVFEWQSRADQIVVDYGPEDNLVLTAIRYTVGGEYLSWHLYNDYGRYWDIPVVKGAEGLGEVNDIHSIVRDVRGWKGPEGVVIRYENGHMLKLKADDYVLRHRTADGLKSPKRALELVLSGGVDDVVPLLNPSDTGRLLEYERNVSGRVNEIVDDVMKLYELGISKHPDKRSFATQFVQSDEVPERYKNILYAVYGGGGVDSVVREFLLKRSGAPLLNGVVY